MVTRVNGGVINNQVLTGSLRYFLLNAAAGEPGPFEYTIGPSDQQRADWAVVVDGGAGFVVGDIGLTLQAVGGTGTAAEFEILTVEDGQVTSVKVAAGFEGDYSVIPANPVATDYKGAVVNVDWSSRVIVLGYTLPDGNDYFVGVDAPVPYSAAERVLEVMSQKATIVNIALLAGTQEILVVCESTGFGWDVDNNDLRDAIRALGTFTVPDDTNTGVTADVTALTVTEKFFNDGISP